MRQRPRLRWMLKWAGTATCALMLIFSVVTCFYWFAWSIGVPKSRTSSHSLIVTGRGVTRVWHRSITASRPEFDLTADTGFHRITGSPTWPWIWWCHYEEWISFGSGRIRYAVAIPLWMPFVLVFVPTAYLWYRDRRHPPGHCQTCGYNLTGNTSGRCPECGRPANNAAHLPQP